jgi:DNA-binding NtrC family response regulator
MDLYRKLREMTILLIDDDEWIRDSLSIFFEGEGCHITALQTAEEGIEEVKRKHYDIIISDYRLPGMDGLEFFKRIRNDHPDTLNVLITAFGNKTLMKEANRLGIRDFIEKPFSTRTIEESLSGLIG